MTESDHTDDTGIASELESTTDGFTVHHIDEQAAERAVDEFRKKADRADDGEDVGLRGRIFIEDELLAQTADESTFLIDGEPLGSWLADRVDRRVIDTSDE
jgi:hypothetical protein